MKKNYTSCFSLILFLKGSTLMGMQEKSYPHDDITKDTAFISLAPGAASSSSSSTGNPERDTLDAKLDAWKELGNSSLTEFPAFVHPSQRIEPLNQLQELIKQFKEFQNNKLLNVPENKQLSMNMLTSMQTLLDKATNSSIASPAVTDTNANLRK